MRLSSRRGWALLRQHSVLLCVVVLAVLWAGVFLTFRQTLVSNHRDQVKNSVNLGLLFEETTLRTIGEVEKALFYLRRNIEARLDKVDYHQLVTRQDIISEPRAVTIAPNGDLLITDCDLFSVLIVGEQLSKSRTYKGGHRSFDILHIATAVELSATASPSTMLSTGGNPNAAATNPAPAAVIPTCRPPAASAVRHMWRSSVRENSMPSVNINSTTPISARFWITGSERSIPVSHNNPVLPINTPLSRYPTSRLCLKRTSTSETSTANTSTSVNKANNGEISAAPAANMLHPNSIRQQASCETQ